MLNVLATSAPQTPNVTALCRELEIDRKQGVKMLYALDRAFDDATVLMFKGSSYRGRKLETIPIQAVILNL